MTSELNLSVITSQKPKILSKSFSLSADGTLEKHPGGQLIRGYVQRLHTDLQGFVDLLSKVAPNQALTYGVPACDFARIVPQAKLKNNQTDPPTIARDRAHFAWPEGAGIAMLDYDPEPGKTPLSREELFESVYQILPDLQEHPHIWTASASSNIYTEEGQELRGTCGQRIYIPVSNASDIPRFGQILFDRFWLAGHGRYDVSKSGALLPRAPIDASVWQPERLDFCGGASCGRGLAQRRPAPMIFNAEAAFLDTRTAIADLSSHDQKTLTKLKNEARAAVEPQRKERQAQWCDERLQEAVAKLPKNLTDDQHTIEMRRIAETFKRAVETKRLMAEFVLHSEQFGPVSVKELLNSPDKFHKTRFADPLEPEYSNDPRIAIANLKNAGGPFIYSHAHGGQRFSLHREIESVRLEAGALHRITERILKNMRGDYRVYDRGELTRISEGQLFPVTPGWLTVYLNGLLGFEKWDGRRKEYVPTDCPDNLAKKITELAGEWKLPKLSGIITAPTMTPTGRVIEHHGFDSETGLYLEFPNTTGWDKVSEFPPVPTIKAALARLWHPFTQFPFETAVDRGVHLATLFCAVVRQLLTHAPGIYYGAHTAGAGKTMLANCVSLLAGQEPTAYPPTESEEEMRKRLATVARAGARAVIIDNLVGMLRSSSLCTFLTSRFYSDRVLGESTSMSVPTNFLLLLTGNNVGFFGDLNRRVLRCTIDPRCERPDKRRFSLHPPTYVRDHRLEMIHAALTILRGFVAAGAPAPKNDMGDFCEWSNLVRGAVIWVGENGWLDVGDPGASTDAGYEQDDDTQRLGALLLAWKGQFGIDNSATAARAVRLANNQPGGDLAEAIRAVADVRGSLNSARFGYWLRSHRGRFVERMRFVQDGFEHKVARWKIELSLHAQKGGDDGDRGDISTPRARNGSGGNALYIGEREESPPSPSSPPFPRDIDRETREERAAILEFDAGMSPEEANRAAGCYTN